MKRLLVLMAFLSVAACGSGEEPDAPPAPVRSELGLQPPRLAHRLPFVPASSNPGGVLRLGDKWLFTAMGDGVGRELWLTDGTPKATSLVRDLNPGPPDAEVRFPLTVVGGQAFFFTGYSQGPQRGRLWRTDGTPRGTVEVMSPRGDVWTTQVVLDGVFYFASETGSGDISLWRTDGTPEGTLPVVPLRPDRSRWPSASFSFSPRFFVFQGQLYYVVEPAPGADKQLWKRGGAAQEPSLVTQSQDFGAFLAIGDRLFFTTGDWFTTTLWVTDGTPQGTRQLTDVLGVGHPSKLVEFNGLLYFYFQEWGVETLWRSDGTREGTFAVRPPPPGLASWVNDGVSLDATRLYFVSTGGLSTEASDHKVELWRGDGTLAGSSLIKTLSTGNSSFYDGGGLARWGNDVYFTAEDAEAGHELWRTDGTLEGTRRVVDLRPGPGGSTPYLYSAEGALFLSADDGFRGRELYRTDGTAEGTQLVADLHVGSYQGSRPVAVDKRVFFATSVGEAGQELWTSDGTERGTRLVKDIRPGPESSTPSHLVEFGGKLYFMASSVWGRAELWVSDGTEAGTFAVHPVADTGPMLPVGFSPIAVLDGALYFFGGIGSTGFKDLWRSDGTAAGTTLLRAFPRTEELTVSGNRLFFLSEGAPWLSDGTAEGTRPIPLPPVSGTGGASYSGGSTRSFLAPAGPGRAFVLKHLWSYAPAPSRSAWHDWFLFITDGTPEGTRQLVAGTGDEKRFRLLDPRNHNTYREEEFMALNGAFFFYFDGALWKTDGTPEGTARVRDFSAFNSAATAPRSPQRLGDVLVFIGFDAEGGDELWRTDGTPEGTQRVVDLLPGPRGSLIQQELYPLGDGRHVLFTAADGLTGVSLWISDGTEKGTRQLKNALPGNYPLNPEQLLRDADGIYFSAVDAQEGAGLWQLKLEPEPEAPVPAPPPGCGATGGAPSLALAALGLALMRRRSRAT